MVLEAVFPLNLENMEWENDSLPGKIMEFCISNLGKNSSSNAVSLFWGLLHMEHTYYMETRVMQDHLHILKWLGRNFVLLCFLEKVIFSADIDTKGLVYPLKIYWKVPGKLPQSLNILWGKAKNLLNLLDKLARAHEFRGGSQTTL